MHSLEGIPSPILITARHFVNFAPIPAYSLSLSSSPSRPTVTVSPGQLSIGCKPLSTFMPGNAPCFEIMSLNRVPSAADCLIVSSNKITPPIFPSIPFDLKSISL